MSDQTPQVPPSGENPPGENPPAENPPSGQVPPPPSEAATPPPPPPPPPPGAYPPPPPAWGQPQYGAPAYGNMPSAGLPPTGLPTSAYANWGLRAASFLIDGFIAGIPIGIGYVIDGPRTHFDLTTGTSTSTNGGPVYFLLLLVSVAIWFWNSCYRQGKTGQSLGKQAVGTTCLAEATMQPIGIGMQFVRQILHIVDQLACYLGYLWPIWDKKRQCFSDKIVHTVVIPKPRV